MSHSLQFLHARIGRVDEWTVRAKLVAGTLPVSATNAAQSFRRWVKLDDERGQLVAQLETAKLELRFASRSAHRQVQRNLHTWSRPFACYVELSGDADSALEGSLFVMRTALPTALAAAPTIVIPTKLLDEIEGPRRPSLQELAQEAVLPAESGPLLVVTTPLLLGTAPTGGAPVVHVHLHRRWTLQCELTWAARASVPHDHPHRTRGSYRRDPRRSSGRSARRSRGGWRGIAGRGHRPESVTASPSRSN